MISAGSSGINAGGKIAGDIIVENLPVIPPDETDQQP
jgi:hypothetical protein